MNGKARTKVQPEKRAKDIGDVCTVENFPWDGSGVIFADHYCTPDIKKARIVSANGTATRQFFGRLVESESGKTVAKVIYRHIEIVGNESENDQAQIHDQAKKVPKPHQKSARSLKNKSSTQRRARGKNVAAPLSRVIRNPLQSVDARDEDIGKAEARFFKGSFFHPLPERPRKGFK